MSDEKLRKFEALAEKRVSEAIKRIRLVGNLSNKNNYSYTDKHVRQMFDALEGAIKASKQRFRNRTPSESELFKFRDTED